MITKLVYNFPPASPLTSAPINLFVALAPHHLDGRYEFAVTVPPPPSHATNGRPLNIRQLCIPPPPPFVKTGPSIIPFSRYPLYGHIFATPLKQQRQWLDIHLHRSASAEFSPLVPLRLLLDRCCCRSPPRAPRPRLCRRSQKGQHSRLVVLRRQSTTTTRNQTFLNDCFSREKKKKKFAFLKTY